MTGPGAQRRRRPRHALAGGNPRRPAPYRRAGRTAAGGDGRQQEQARVIHSLRRTFPARGGAPMKIAGIDTFTLRIPTVKPIALDLPEHRLVVTRIHTDAGPEGLGYSLVFGGGGSEAVEAYARRLAELLIGEDPCSSAGCGTRCTAPTAASGAWASPATRSPRWTSGSGISRARRPACRSPSSGARRRTAWTPTAAAAGAPTRSTTSSARASATRPRAAATTR